MQHTTCCLCALPQQGDIQAVPARSQLLQAAVTLSGSELNHMGISSQFQLQSCHKQGPHMAAGHRWQHPLPGHRLADDLLPAAGLLRRHCCPAHVPLPVLHRLWWAPGRVHRRQVSSVVLVTSVQASSRSPEWLLPARSRR